MILYHGSNIEIENVDLSKTRKGKDFGKGFYLSADYKQAINIEKIQYTEITFQYFLGTEDAIKYLKKL